MEGPHVRYATALDGTRIAYAVIGSGPPLFLLDSFTNAGLSARPGRDASFYETLAANRSLVLFDWRGSGQSGPASEFTIASLASDIESVAHGAGLATFDLCAFVAPCHVAIEYAAAHPDRVRKLILCRPAPRGHSALTTPAAQPIAHLVATDWEHFTDLYALRLVGWTEAGRELAEQVRRHWTAASFAACMEAFEAFDTSASAASITSETLVLTFDEDGVFGDPSSSRQEAQRLAAIIPNSHLHILRGNAEVLRSRLVEPVDRFLRFTEESTTDPPEGPVPESLPEGAVVILFTDIVESTALTERLGDAAFRTRARDLDASLRTLVSESGGTPVEGTLLGDGLLAVFTSARQAIDCALRCNAAAEAASLQLHLGLHAGDVLREGNNVYGGAVNIAARIMSLTAPGQVLVSDTVRSLARTSAGVSFADQGEHALKGIADPVRVFEVRGRSNES